MGYNAMSGAIRASSVELRNVSAVTAATLSGSLLYGNGASVTEIPRIVANASADNLLTVGANANSMVGEPNLTFDGSLLTVNGDITASVGVTANTLYAGDSFFTGTVNISASRGLTITGSIAPSGSNAFSLGSPSNRWKELFVGTGSIHIGTNGATIASNEVQDIITFNKTISSSLNMSASAFYGDGGNLINVKADHVVAEGPIAALQFHDIDGDITGSVDLMFSSSVLAINGGLQMKRVSVVEDYSISTTDYYVGVDTVNASGVIALGLPNAALMRDGQTVVVKDEGGSANARNITINAAIGQTIDGQNSVVLESPYASIHLYCNGANRYFIY